MTVVLDFNLNEPPIILKVSEIESRKLSCLVQNANPKEVVWRDDKNQIIPSDENLIVQQVSLLAPRPRIQIGHFLMISELI